MTKITKEEMLEAKELTRQVLEQPLSVDSDLTGVMKVLNEDRIEPDSKLQSIDLKTRLHPIELSSIIIHDVVVNLGCLPKECLLTTRTKKRLAVSLKGEGRKEMVQMVQSERNRKSEGGFFSKLFGGNKDGAA